MPVHSPDVDPRWTAVSARDTGSDGRFFYAVRTTGVYCRPSCASRLALPENVSFHATAAAAEGAGFRPCKRCRPQEPALVERRAAVISQVCRHIENSPQPPTLQELARQAGISVFHLHRLFKAATGVTPRAYAAAHRMRRVEAELASSRTVSEAIYQAGFGSSGRFYARSNQHLGMTPTKFRAGGSQMEIQFAVASSSLGSILVAATERGVCAILIGETPALLRSDLERRFPRARVVAGDSRFKRLVVRVVAQVEKPGAPCNLPLDIRGTAFQQRVWQALLAIPAGTTTSYAAIAGAVGAPKAVRAVAQACGANHLAVVIPCHRVIRSDGGLSGYRWGIDRKRAILARERGPLAAEAKKRRSEP